MTLLDRLPFRRKTNPPPQPTTQQRFAFLTETIIDRFYVRRITAFLDDLEKTEAWWPVVLPLLAWVGWRTYHNERRKILEERMYNKTDS